MGREYNEHSSWLVRLDGGQSAANSQGCRRQEAEQGAHL